MDYWRGPHSGIISASRGLDEYRQVHLAEENPGQWPRISGVETSIPQDRKIDGVAEVTFDHLIAPLQGRPQTKLAHADEINVFRRTLLYAAPPYSARWYETDAPSTDQSVSSLIYIRRRDGVGIRKLQQFMATELAPWMLESEGVTELRTQVFLPWLKSLWNTPHVAHDNPPESRFHGSIAIGFSNVTARDAFFLRTNQSDIQEGIRSHLSAIHAYDVQETLTFVRDGLILPTGA